MIQKYVFKDIPLASLTIVLDHRQYSMVLFFTNVQKNHACNTRKYQIFFFLFCVILRIAILSKETPMIFKTIITFFKQIFYRCFAFFKNFFFMKSPIPSDALIPSHISQETKNSQSPAHSLQPPRTKILSTLLKPNTPLQKNSPFDASLLQQSPFQEFLTSQTATHTNALINPSIQDIADPVLTIPLPLHSSVTQTFQNPKPVNLSIVEPSTIPCSSPNASPGIADSFSIHSPKIIERTQSLSFSPEKQSFTDSLTEIFSNGSPTNIERKTPEKIPKSFEIREQQMIQTIKILLEKHAQTMPVRHRSPKHNPSPPAFSSPKHITFRPLKKIKFNP